MADMSYTVNANPGKTEDCNRETLEIAMSVGADEYKRDNIKLSCIIWA